MFSEYCIFDLIRGSDARELTLRRRMSQETKKYPSISSSNKFVGDVCTTGFESTSSRRDSAERLRRRRSQPGMEGGDVSIMSKIRFAFLFRSINCKVLPHETQQTTDGFSFLHIYYTVLSHSVEFASNGKLAQNSGNGRTETAY